MKHRDKVICIALGLVSATGFAPLGWWPLTLIAFAGLMHLVSQADQLKSALARGYWFGVGHFTLGLNWIAGSFRYQDTMPVWLGWFAVVALALYLAIYPAMAAGLAWRWGILPLPFRGEGRRAGQSELAGFGASPGGLPLSQPSPLKGRGLFPFTLFFAAAWIVTEWLRATMFTGFAWNPLSVALIDLPLIRDVSKTIGTYGLSAWIPLVSGFIATFLGPWIKGVRSHLKDGTWPTYLIGPPLVSVAVLYIASSFLLPSPDLRAVAGKAAIARPLLRVVQPNIGQQNKYDESYDVINFQKLEELTGGAGKTPRLILWPEAAVPDFLDEELWARMRVATLLGPKDILLTGADKLLFDKNDKIIGAHNSVFVIDAQARVLARYDKAHLVPYGEYLALRWLLEPLGATRLVPGDIDFLPGPGPRSIDLPGFAKVGVQICYEIIFSGEVVDKNNRPAFIFNPSNDAWFGSWGSPQFVAQSRLRAIEEGLPVIRSTPTGISAIIDANGRVIKSLPSGKPGFIEAPLPRAHQPTLFSRYGNMLPFGFAILLTLIGIALGRRVR